MVTCCRLVSLLVGVAVASVAFALDMSGTPFLSEQNKEWVEKEYEGLGRKCQSSYTLAISRDDRMGAYCHSRLSTEEVSRIALEKCEHSALDPCGLVVVTGRVVEFRESPMSIRYPETFTASQVPFVSTKARSRLKKKYERARGHKALAITRNGTYWYSVRRSSEEEAKEKALGGCEKDDRRRNRCFIYAVGSKVVFDIFTNVFPER